MSVSQVAEDGSESYEVFPTKDRTGKPCYVSFTPEELAEYPQLRTDDAFREEWMKSAPRTFPGRS